MSPPTAVWGAQLYLLDQVAALADRGVHLTLGTPADSPFATAWRERGFPHLDLPLERHVGLRIAGSDRRPGWRSMLGSAQGVWRGVRTLVRVVPDYDMVYSFSLRSHLEVAIAGRVARVPTALDLVDHVQPGMGRRVLRVAATLATRTVANSTATAAVLGDRDDVEIIHPGIDLSRFHPGERDESLRSELVGGRDRPLVAVIGRLDAKKGVHVLVEAMHLMAARGVEARLLVVGEHGTGDPIYAEQLRERATRLLDDRVRFLGRRDDVPDILRAVDVLVVASDAEPFGLTALEAQASRTPVVGTDAGGLPEFVRHEETGLLVPPGDAPALARAIERVIAGGPAIDAMVDEAERRANPDRGLEAQFDRIAAMYRSVAAA